MGDRDEVALQYDLFGAPTEIRPRPRIAEPSPLDGRNPYLVTGPACLSFSGGLTSAYMVRKTLDAHNGRLPPDVHILFENTGKERPETLDFISECAVRWGAYVRWLERDPDAETGFREVDYETASRQGEPFAALNESKKYLPNSRARFCTQELKIEVMRGFMRAEGYDRWTNVVGLRRDEAKRVHDMRSQDPDQWDLSFPLYEAGIRKLHIGEFWLTQPFRLALEPWEGNCDLCFLKGLKKRERIMRDRPDLVPWWADQEKARRARFHAHEPGYAATLDRVRHLPMIGDPVEDDDTIPCFCTERRQRSRCTCGKRRGAGHALWCAMVLGPERRAA